MFIMALKKNSLDDNNGVITMKNSTMDTSS